MTTASTQRRRNTSPLAIQMQDKFFANGHKLPECVNHGCDRNVLVRNWTNWSIKSECSRCVTARQKNKTIPGVVIHKKSFCENVDGQLGWVCPVPRDGWIGFENALDLDHLDGDHYNNVPSNVKTYCKICHARKSILKGDCNSRKKSSRAIA